MAKFTYPTGDLDQRENLVALLGSHWNNVYRGSNVSASFLFARAQEEIQSYLDLAETVASISRLSVPIYHRDNWYLLELKESDRNSQQLKYAPGSRVYGDGASYGEPPDTPWFTWPLPGKLADVSTICNRILLPSVTYTKGLDFVLEDGLIKFNTDPFENTSVPKREVYKSSQIVDRSVGLWLYRGEFDWKHIETHFGFIAGVIGESSRSYRDFVNALLDSFAQGTSASHIDTAVSALTGVPLVREAVEVVEHIFTDHRGLAVVTDKNVYRFNAAATAIVAVGDTLYAGDRLTNSFNVIEFRNGEVPADLLALHVGEGFIGTGFMDGVGFANKEVPLQISSDVNGITRVEFEVGGFPSDVTLFWDEVHTRGLLSTTLAKLLDIRGTDAPTEPGPASLPTTVNPLKFLVQNLLRFHTFLIRIRAQEAVSGIGLDYARLLRRIVPPWTALIFLFELEITEDAIDPTFGGNSTQPGATESLVPFIGSNPNWSQDTVDPGVFTNESVKVYLVKGVCE